MDPTADSTADPTADATPLTDPLSADELLLWQSLGRLVHSLPRTLEQDMSRTGVTMTEFAVLLLLSEAPDRRMRMSALAAASGVTPPRVTRIIDGLSRHDLVRKERHGQDARGSEAVLTDAGLRAMHAAQPSHLASARRRVLDHIPADLLPAIAATLAELAELTEGGRRQQPS
ncbi:MarR family transcriptional regulator [Streptomyces prunicolor]|jgi:DNA-binding MarR family transcriptional regulator|uniref:MarR family winged helix-turn-helix transcriptional regulator n=1 Tax=Streptomyces prunicolor TaxID=67348 RepID=UPI00224E8D25|nr:MarR family transcriptional regulator [Streptomyces prunicolor]MCX5233780.1 MarR family transcriptional regulator [Streptomyces prunicolor]